MNGKCPKCNSEFSYNMGIAYCKRCRKVSEDEITKEDIERNIKNIDNGEPLDLPLMMLDGVFKSKYIKSHKTKEEMECIKRYQKRYQKSPKYRAYLKKYIKRPYVKAKIKERRQRPEEKARRREWEKEYIKRPEIIARI